MQQQARRSLDNLARRTSATSSSSVRRSHTHILVASCEEERTVQNRSKEEDIVASSPNGRGARNKASHRRRIAMNSVRSIFSFLLFDREQCQIAGSRLLLKQGATPVPIHRRHVGWFRTAILGSAGRSLFISSLGCVPTQREGLGCRDA